MALHDKQKNKFRRVIRIIMVVLAALLLLLGFGVPIANNALAMQVAKNVAALPLPAETTLVETTSLSGRLTNPYGSVQYFGAILLKSDLSLEKLQEHYWAYNQPMTLTYRVLPQTTQEISVVGEHTLAFREPIAKEGYYIVCLTQNGGHTLQWWLDMDIR